MTNYEQPTTQPPDQEGRAVINKTLARVAAAIAVIVSGLAYLFYTPIDNRGIYANKISSYITTKEGRQGEADWLKKQGLTSVDFYGISEYVGPHPDWVADLILRVRRNGVTKQVGFIYSKPEQVTVSLDKYQKLQKSDSTRFSATVMEYEQYQKDKSRSFFYSMNRIVGNYDHSHNLKHIIYQGWPSATDCDSIVKYVDRIYLHAYLEFDKLADIGGSCFGYQKSRLTMLANSMNKMYPKDPNRKLSHALLTSTENPDQTKTQFGYKYFKTHSFEDPEKSVIKYLKTQTQPLIKSRIEFGNSQLFVEDQAKKIKP